jgi:predicted 3-demethylubiquinone-9 3-methyltransferase (glyoxalase superfamily)
VHGVNGGPAVKRSEAFSLMEAVAAGGAEAKRAFDAMLGMKKIDVDAIQAARRG